MTEPNRGGPLVLRSVGALIGLAMIVGGLSQGDAWPLALLGIGVIPTTYFIAKYGLRRALEFERMGSRHLRERNRIKGEIHALSRTAPETIPQPKALNPSALTKRSPCATLWMRRV